MADKKITQLTNITGANLVDADEFVVVDISADETKAITLGELKEAFDSGSGFVRITGDTMTGDLSLSGADVTFGDNDKAIFGAGDLQIYHNGVNSYIDDTGTGNLVLRGNSAVSLQKYTGETLGVFNADGPVNLFYDNAQKFATTSTGIDVTGTVTADGLTVDGGLVTYGDFTGTAAGIVRLSGNGTTLGTSSFDLIQNSSGSFVLTRNNETLHLGTNNIGDRLSIAGNGDISFYEDTGTTPKFFWDASAESLGLGATSFAGETLRMERSGDMIVGLFSGASNGTYLNMGTTSNRDIGQIGYTQSTNNMFFRTNDAERMRIDSSGNVGIGTSSPSQKITVGFADNGTDGISFRSSSYANLAKILVQNETSSQNGNLQFHTRSGGNVNEAMRIDSSGNLLVGKTATNYQTVGVEAKGNGSLWATADGNGPLVVTRKTSNGALADFYKDTTKVGSIGAADGIFLKIDTSYSGLFFDGGKILPTVNGSLSDGGQDLGRGATRFKDLYLSGGVYLGGTGSANKLDDYEEGTWTPEYNDGQDFIVGATAVYRKVGNLVWVNFDVTGVSGRSSSTINNLPFTSSSTGGNFSGYTGYETLSTSSPIYSHMNANSSYVQLFVGSSSVSINAGERYIGAVVYSTD